MKKSVREYLQSRGVDFPELPKKEKPMSEQNPAVGITFEQLQELIKTLVTEQNKLNPLEQKKLDEAIERERRMKIMHLVQANAEEMARWNKQHGCSHSADKTTGDPVPSGTGRWTTGGQLHGNDTATLICQRCGCVWHFRTSPQERDYINSVGMMGFTPPAIERCLNKDTFVEKAPEPINVDELMAAK